ncbi:MAG: RNA-binding protein [Candidatus Woesearchaeota archaeon]|nr:RNA-binding protein [Candidatus Woesearchaeota archaeon]
MKKQLSKTEVELINAELKLSFGKDFLTKKQRVELLQNKELALELVIVDSLPCFFKQTSLADSIISTNWLPHLKFILTNCFLKRITVDKGAIPFVVKGADIMRPGIVAVDEEITANELVVIIDQTYGKPIAIGKALFSSADMLALNSGKCIQNLHFVGDKVWQLIT